MKRRTEYWELRHKDGDIILDKLRFDEGDWDGFMEIMNKKLGGKKKRNGNVRF
jgi:hypothetical protein